MIRVMSMMLVGAVLSGTASAETPREAWKSLVGVPVQVCRSRCAVKGPQFQQVRVLSRQRPCRPGSRSDGCGRKEAFQAQKTA